MAKLNISPFLDSSVVLPKGLYLSCPQHLTPKAKREKWVSHTEGSQTSFILYWETEDCIAGSGMKKGNVSQLQPWDRHLKNLKCKEGKKKSVYIELRSFLILVLLKKYILPIVPFCVKTYFFAFINNSNMLLFKKNIHIMCS